MEPIVRSFEVATRPEQAFDVFVDGFGDWWPRAYTWSQDVLETIAIEPHEGGRCFERGPHGFECDWGRVLVCDPPHRLAFTWQIGPGREPVPNPARASEVEVRFDADGERGGRVRFEHRGFERHGEDGEGYRAALDSPEGWDLILGRYREAVA